MLQSLAEKAADPLIVISRKLPLNLISFTSGSLARVEKPRWLARQLCEAFVKTFKIDMSLAEKELSEYSSLEELFTRRLKPGLRPLSPPICSPADGALTNSLPAENDRAVQFKGIDYQLSELVFDHREPAAELAWYYTVYLSPKDYHRVHSPVAGKLKKVSYFPGELLAVNEMFGSRVPDLFNRNERMVFEIDAELGGTIYVVMIGALNVGRIRSHHAPHLVTNDLQRQIRRKPRSHEFGESMDLLLGEELGTFMLGSTAVVVLDKAAVEAYPALQQCSHPTPIELGAPIAATP